MRDAKTGTSNRVLIVVIIALVALGGVTLVVADDNVTTSLSPEETAVEAGEQVTVEVVAEDIPDSVGAYETQIAISDPSVAEIVEFEPAGDPKFGGENTITDNGSEAKIAAAYGDDPLEADGDNEVVLATATLEINTTFEFTVEHTVDALGEGDGKPLEIADEGDSDEVVINDDDSWGPGPTEEFVIDMSELEINSPVTEGETFEVDATIVNRLDKAGEAEAKLVSEEGSTLDETSIELPGGTDEAVTLEWDTNADDTGTHTLELQTNNDRTDIPVEVKVDDDDKEPPDLAIEHNPGSVTSSTPIDANTRAYADQLDIFVETDDPVTFGGDADRTLRVVDSDTGEAVTYDPLENEMTGPLDEMHRLGIQNEGTGEPEEVLLLFPEPDSELEFTNIDATVKGETGIFTDEPFGSYVIELLDEEGSVIDATDERLVGMDYEATFDQDGNTATITRDEAVDEDWYVEFRITGDDPERPPREEPLDSVEIDHDDSDDVFEIPLDDLDVDEGEYNWSLILKESENVEPDRERIVQVDGGSNTDNGVVVSDGTNIDDVEVDTTLTNNEVTVSADIEATHADVESVDLGVSADFTSFTVTEPADGSETTGSIEATIDADDVVADGEYTAIVEATDEFGSTATATGDSIVFDTTTPEIQLRVDDLVEDEATLTLEGDKPFDLTDLDIKADGDGVGDRTPADSEIPDRLDGVDDDLAVEFDGGPEGDADTTFTITAEGEDDAGNDVTTELESTIAGYEIEDGGAHVDPDGISTSFNLSADEGAVGDRTTRTAVVAETATPPAGTELDDDVLAGGYLDIDDIGLTENELENATIRIPIDVLDDEITDEFDADTLEILRSPDGDSEYESVDTEFNEDANELVADIDGFSQFVAAGVDDQSPEIDSVDVDPGTDPDPEDGPVTVMFEYSPVISDIDVPATEIDVSVSGERVDAHVTDDSATVDIDDLDSGESIAIDLTVVDDAGNKETATEAIAVGGEEEEDDSDDNGGGGGGFGGGSDAGDETDGEDADAGDETDDEDADVDGETDDETVDIDDGDDEDVDVDDERDAGETDDLESVEDNESQEAGEDDRADDDDGTPGFGFLTGAIALIAATMLALHRRE